MTDRTASAVAPGHLTAFFSVHHDTDPLYSGSRGAGIAVEDGVHVTVSTDADTTLNGDAADIEAVDRVLAAFDAPLGATVETELPIGMGCGVSGAAALATALAADAVLETDYGRSDLVAMAHVADVEAGTGLGDVFAQAVGGATMRLEPGAPPHGRLESIPADGRLEYLPLGTIPTAEVLAGDTAAITAAGESCLEALIRAPSLGRLIDLGRDFADEVSLLDDELRRVLAAVEAAGGRACIGLLGRTVVAPGDSLSRAGYDPVVTRIDTTGAAVVDHR